MTLASASSTASIILKVTPLSTPSSPQHRSTHSISGGIAEMSGATAGSCEAIGPHTVPMGPEPSPISAGGAGDPGGRAAGGGSLVRPFVAFLPNRRRPSTRRGPAWDLLHV